MDDLTEEQARQMEAGEELDTICHRWMKWPTQHVQEYSTEWSAAGPLLEVLMRGDNDKVSGVYLLPRGNIGVRQPGVHAIRSMLQPSGGMVCPLAIARACAVLVARGITREEVEGE